MHRKQFDSNRYTNSTTQDTPLEESIGALDELRRAGKTKYIGLSECSAETLRKANASKFMCNYRSQECMLT
jgi:Predicted oxidoreductases (related to aryl-alcohol dehydrogenases)